MRERLDTPHSRALLQKILRSTRLVRDLPFSGSYNRRGMEHGPEVVDGFSQGIGPETERALDQTYLAPDTVLDLKNPGLPFFQRSHNLKSLEGGISSL